jgi:hypothetical protein
MRGQSIPIPKSLTPEMATEMFPETLEIFQNYAQRIPEYRSHFKLLTPKPEK